MATKSTYSHAFDTTFAAPASPQPAKLGGGGCAESYRLQWLTPVGWCSWAFEAASERRNNVTTQGTYRQGRVLRDTRRQLDPVLILRSAGLDTPTREVLSTVYSSSAVFLIATDAAGNLAATPVRVEPGEQIVSQSRVAIDGITVQVLQPVRHSFRNL